MLEKKIVFLFTPFHYIAASSCVNLFDKNLFIVAHERLTHTIPIKLHTKCHFIPKKFDLSFNLKTIFGNKNKIKLIEQNVHKVIKQHIGDHVSLFSGTDHHVYYQVYLNTIEKSLIRKVVSIDEGVGHYVELNLLMRLKKAVFPLISKILFKHNLEYSIPLGSHTLTDEIYLREPKLHPDIKNKSFKKLNISSNLNAKKIFLNVKDKKSILFCTDVKIDRHATELISTLAKTQKKRNSTLYVKPHPRCSCKVPISNNIVLIESKIAFELLCVKKFEKIFLYNSSAIFHIISSGYNLKNVYNLGRNYKKYKLFDGCKNIRLKNIKKILNEF